MYLTKLLVRDFGKFHNKGMDLDTGINLIVGGPESGKSTLRDFLIGMIYGIPRREGITKVRSNYELRKPTGSTGYSGTAYIKSDENTFLVDRTFLAGAKKASVLDVDSGREVRLEYSDTLSGTLCETDKNTYLDTRCIIESDTIDAKADLKKYLTNIALTGTANINKSEAVKYLENEKKNHIPRPLIRRLDELDERISEYDGIDEEIEAVETEIKALNEEFVMEAERRKRVARRLVENEDGSVSYESDSDLEEKIDKLTERERGYSSAPEPKEDYIKEKKEKEKVEKPFTDRIPVIIGTGIFVILVIAAVVYMLPFEDMIRKLFIGFTALFVFLTIIDGFKEKGVFEGKKSEDELPDEEEFNKVIEELKAEAEQQEELDFDMTFAKEFQEKKAVLKEKEDALLVRRNERAKLRAEFDQVFKKKSELEEEIQAIDFAINKINQLSKGFREDAFKKLFVHISEYISKLTMGTFTHLSFDENGEIILEGDRLYVPLAQLTEEDAGKVFMAVRLSIAKHLAKERLPLIIDGTSMLDSVSEITSFTDVLRSMKEEQIIIFTEDLGMASVLNSKGIDFNLIRL
ncbi:MAG: AAA family ATPase [Eubacterium sp.]|nr:AAA family ATPase [Eubacterium sp.]